MDSEEQPFVEQPPNTRQDSNRFIPKPLLAFSNPCKKQTAQPQGLIVKQTAPQGLI